MGDKNKTQYVSCGISFTGALQIVFIVLKLCGVIDWAWALVLLPLIIECGIVTIVFLVLLMAHLCVKIYEKDRMKRLRKSMELLRSKNKDIVDKENDLEEDN